MRPRTVELNQWSSQLLDELQHELRMPAEQALQLALTHTLSSVMRGNTLHATLPWQLGRGHNRGPEPDA